MAVRSNYIKNLMESKNSLEEQYQKVVAESMKNIIGDSTKEEVRKLLKESEDEDSYEEEEVNDDTATTDKEDITADDTDDSIEDEESTVDDDVDGDLWDDLEKCKSADGEYDCRGMEDKDLIKVLKTMGPEDGIRVMSNGDGTVEVEVDGDKIEGTTNFIIDLDDFEDIDDDDIEIDPEVELEINEADLGYGPKQHDTAMTMDPDSQETTDRHKIGHAWNPQLSKANSNLKANNVGDGNPYENNVNEETEFEIEQDSDEPIEEGVHTTGENNALTRGTGITKPNSNMSHKYARNGAPGADSPTSDSGRGTSDGYKEATNESVVNFKKKVNTVYKENKEMKSLIPQLQKKLMESMVINQSMGYIVRILNENATTVDEKKQISDRFSKVNTLEEGKKLYQTISEELKRANKRNDMNGIINGQIAEGKQTKQSLVETTMYKSEKVNETLDFMKRLNAIK